MLELVPSFGEQRAVPGQRLGVLQAAQLHRPPFDFLALLQDGLAAPGVLIVERDLGNMEFEGFRNRGIVDRRRNTPEQGFCLGLSRCISEIRSANCRAPSGVEPESAP